MKTYLAIGFTLAVYGCTSKVSSSIETITHIPNSSDLTLLTKKWAHGAPKCESQKQLPLDVLSIDNNTIVLRQNKCSSYEAPFMYLLIGKQMALLFDTGAIEDPNISNIYSQVNELIGNRGDNFPLLVLHSHGHSDHTKGDIQFTNKANTQIVGTKKKALVDHFDIPQWPNSQVEIDLGGRLLTLIPTPGHHDDAVSLYDEKHKLLLTGDTLYPGQVIVKEWDEYKDSIKRLTQFSTTHNIEYILGGHIEMKAVAGEMYAIGTTYQPDEHHLALQAHHLLRLNDELQKQAHADEIKLDDFIVTPMSFLQKVMSSVLNWIFA